MCDEKERLKEKLLLDMTHWSIGALQEAKLFIDGMVLSQSGDDFLWWWDLRKRVDAELEAKKVTP